MKNFLKCQHSRSKLNLIFSLTIIRGGKLVYLNECRDKNNYSLNEIAVLNENDLLVIPENYKTQLLSISGQTSAQLLYISSQNLSAAEKSLVDLTVTPSEFSLFREEMESLEITAREFRHENIWQDTLRPALLLDRDGIINVEKKYITDPNQIELLPKIENLIKLAYERGYAVVVVTNQSGLGRGYLDWTAYDQITNRVGKLLAQKGAWLENVQAAPHFIESKFEWAWSGANRRKPRTAMIHKAAKDLRIDLTKSILLGDRSSDLILGFVLDLKNVYLLNSPIAKNEWTEWEQWLASAKESGLEVTRASHKVKILNQISDLDLEL